MEISELSIEEKVAQLFMVGIHDKDIDGIIDLIKNEKIGGVVLYGNNFDNYKEMVNLVNRLKKVNSENPIPLCISIDQEGGRVNRMPDEILNIQCATKIAETQDVELARRSGNLIGKMLNETGISMNYGPVLDIRRFKENHPIGDRCYGENKDDVEKYGIPVMQEMQKQNVISVVKHFPGHGLTQKDSHFQVPRITDKIEKLENEDMEIFKTAIDNGADAIMVGHLIIKDVDRRYPASLSKKIIQAYLIEKYHYKGLIITDDLKMMAIRIHYNMNKAVLKAVDAGNDIVMVGLPYSKVKKLIKYITKQVKKGRISERRINESVKKINAFKERYNIKDEEVKGFDIEEMNKEILSLRDEITK